MIQLQLVGMDQVSKTIDWFGRNIVLTWIETRNPDEISKYSPVTQAYGICFNGNGEILILDQDDNGKWTLPGGTVEEGETPVETLVRETDEEADVTLKKIKLLGVQIVDDPQNSDPNHRLYYQARYIAKIDQVLPQTPDPSKNRIHERRFVLSNEVTKYIKWSNTGDAIFATAIGHYKRIRSRV